MEKIIFKNFPYKTTPLNDANLNQLQTNVENALNNKVDKVEGKGLSTNDYTTTEKNKLGGIEAGANKYVHPSSHPASIITQDENNRFVSDTEKSNWSGKQDKLESAINIKTINGTSVLGSGNIATKNLIAEYTFTSPGKIITFNNLDINADGGIYDVIVIGAGLTANDSNPGPLKVYYNNDTNDVNYMYRRIYAKADDTLSTSGGNAADGGYIYKVTTFNNIAIVLSGEYPTLNCANTIVASADVEALNYVQYCTSKKTNITSLTFSTGNNMGVGTTIKIYKRN